MTISDKPTLLLLYKIIKQKTNLFETLDNFLEKHKDDRSTEVIKALPEIQKIIEENGAEFIPIEKKDFLKFKEILSAIENELKKIDGNNVCLYCGREHKDNDFCNKCYGIEKA